MLSVNGIYENGQVTLLEALPYNKPVKVIVTVLEESELTSSVQSSLNSNKKKSWRGCMEGTARIVGDIVNPMEESWSDWKVLSP